MSDRLSLIEVPSQRARLDFAAAVCEGLRSNPKSLPSRFFYDRRGSELFEQITNLPEYYLTRCEASIFESCRDEIVAEAVVPCGTEAGRGGLSLVEFGSGSSKKTRQLISAILEKQSKLDYAPIDISKEFLVESSKALLGEFPSLRITALAGEYFDCIGAMPDFDQPKLILFLGSNIGNFENAEAIDFLKCLAEAMTPHDRLLVGTDLVKDSAVIEAAYNDLARVTAEFNLNLLARIDRELDGTFDPSLFAHEAPYSKSDERVEMRLVSKIEQQVCVEALDLPVQFRSGERIHTEFSQKYTEESFRRLTEQAGLRSIRRWSDERGWFALDMLRKA